MNKLLLFAALALTSCGKLVKDYVPPTDEATPQERRQIDNAVSEIETIMRANGNETDYKKIPIVVTSENPETNHRYGYCQITDGEGRYIVINRQAFVTATEKLLDPVFALILHEFGHCYFKLDHDERIIVSPGNLFEYWGYTADHTVTMIAKAFPVSIMNTQESGFNPVAAFKTYYVRQLLGQTELKSLEDALNMPGIRLKQLH